MKKVQSTTTSATKRKDPSTLLQQAKAPQSVNITVGKQGVPVLLQQLLVAHIKNDLIHLKCKNKKQGRGETLYELSDTKMQIK